MSRTIHNIGFRCHRNMRHINRLQSAMARIPNPWDDYNYSSGTEYHNKHRWDKEFENA